MGKVIFFSGLPKAGKSVTLHALFSLLVAARKPFFLERVNPDQEGNWALETPNGTDAARKIKNSLKEKGEFFSRRFVERKLRDIIGLSKSSELLLLDMGGIPSSENREFVLAATGEVFAVILVRGDGDTTQWQTFWQELGVTPVLVKTKFGEADFEAEKERLAKSLAARFELI